MYNTDMYRHTFALHPGPWLAVIVLLAVLIVVFEVWMIIDVALNKHLSDKAKTWWIIGMVLIHPFVALVYYFTDRTKQ